jgi:hypothetical protein
VIATGASAFLLAVLLAQGHHAASSSRKTATTTASTSTPAPKREASTHRKDDAATNTAATSTPAETTSAEASKPAKTRTYTFGAMDVEGKMKTPQLLYFLNRVKLELEMSAPDKKSFMKDLEQSANDSSL